MNKDIATIWVEALRSGEYSQGKNKLQDLNGFCCLGVLCNLGEKAGISVTKRDGRLVGNYLHSQKEIMEWSGINSPIGVYVGSEKTVSDLNDEGKSFEVIADIIEQNWDKF